MAAVAEWESETMWFGVDREGRVAVFLANECGAVPNDVDLTVNSDEMLDALRVASDDGEAEAQGADDDGVAEDDRQGALPSGVYVYWHDGGWLAWPYDCQAAPDSALSRANLPPRTVARMAVFDGRFAEHAQLQPLEHWSCIAPVACWLGSDQKTVRCIPGHESEFAADAETVEKEFPGDYSIELPTTTPRPWWQFWK